MSMTTAKIANPCHKLGATIDKIVSASSSTVNVTKYIVIPTILLRRSETLGLFIPTLLLRRSETLTHAR